MCARVYTVVVAVYVSAGATGFCLVVLNKLIRLTFAPTQFDVFHLSIYRMLW